MKADEQFLGQAKAFWANVRTISQVGGYTVRGTGSVKVYSMAEMTSALRQTGLGTSHIVKDGHATPLGERLRAYFKFRADVLNTFVEPRLMDVERARDVFRRMRDECQPRCPLPLNKQKGEKAGPAYLSGIVNMLIEQNTEGLPVDYDPRKLTTVTYNDAPLRTLSRRLDGAFPSTVNPIAVWEIKEYYYTTTFGSRIADGVYETQLDGMELEELRENEGVKVRHLLIIDSHFTWWSCGRSYLCRIIDMLHMGYVDEVLFGFEVVERLPSIVRDWVAEFR